MFKGLKKGVLEKELEKVRDLEDLDVSSTHNWGRFPHWKLGSDETKPNFKLYTRIYQKVFDVQPLSA